MQLLRNSRWRNATTALILASGTFVSVVSCGGVAPDSVPVAERPTRIRMQPNVVETFVEVSVQLKADVLNSAGAVLPNAELLWSTNDARVVTVDATGLIRTHGVGTAQVGAQHGSLSASAHIVVAPLGPQPVLTIEFELSPIIELGATRQLQAMARDADGNALPDRLVTFSTNNPAVANTLPSGLLQAVSLGVAQITASTEGHQTSRTITVTPSAVATVSVSPTRLDLLVGASGKVTSSAFATNGMPLTARATTFTSSAPTIATVDDEGVVLAKAPGTSIVTATIEGKLASATVVVTPVISTASGMDIAVSSPTDISIFHVTVDGAGLAAPITSSQFSAPGRRTASVHVLVPPGGPYRVRVIGGATQSPEGKAYVATTGMSSSVVVPTNGFASVSVATSSPTVSFVAPASVNVSQPVDVTWTVVDAGASLDRAGGPVGRLWNNFGRTGDAAGTPVIATATKINATTYRYTAHFTAPTLATKLYYQFESMTWDPASPTLGQTGHLFTPVLNYGDSAYTMTVQQSPTPIRLAITSTIPSNEYVVVIDGGPLGTAQVLNGVGGNMMTSGTATIGLPPGGPYRIRVLSPSRLSSDYRNPIVNETGVLRNVTVVTGVAQDLSLALAAPSVAISIPATAKLGQPLDVSWTYTDPGEALDLLEGPIGLIQYLEYSDQDFSGYKQTVAGVRVNATTYKYSARIPTASTTGKLFYHVGAQVITMPSFLTRVGWYLNPSQVRLEPVPFITLTP